MILIISDKSTTLEQLFHVSKVGNTLSFFVLYFWMNINERDASVHYEMNFAHFFGIKLLCEDDRKLFT